MPTSLPATATKAPGEDFLLFAMPDTEASIFEEPGAKKRHAGICAGRSGNWPSYRNGEPIESANPRWWKLKGKDERCHKRDRRS
jgi:hypothetical protein